MVWNDPEKQQAGVRPSYCMVNAGFWGKEKGQLHRFFPWSQVSIPLNKPVHLTAGDCTCTETDTQILWKVTQTTFRAKMEVEIACNKEEMLLINYESPDGFKRHTRLWNCGNGFAPCACMKNGRAGGNSLMTRKPEAWDVSMTNMVRKRIVALSESKIPAA